MSLSKRTQDILEIAICDKKASAELVSLLDSEGSKASFSGSVMASAAVAAQFDGQVAGMTTDVTIDADVAGAAGNVTLTADSVSDIDALIAAHNLANPANTLTLSAGDGSQVPTADITLASGADQVDFTLTVEADSVGVAGNVTIAGDGIQDCATLLGAGFTISAGGASIPASGESVTLAGGIDAGGDMSSRTQDFIRVALCDKKASDEFISLVEAHSGSMSSRTKAVLSVALCDNKALVEISSIFA